MDKFTALMKADEVKTFPTLEMPAPKIHMNPGRLRKVNFYFLFSFEYKYKHYELQLFMFRPEMMRKLYFQGC